MSNPPFNPSALEQALPVPVIGPWIARIGYVADMFANPCHPTPTVWLEAAGSAGIRVFASLRKPFNLAETFNALKGGIRRHGLKKLLAGGFSGRGLGYIQALEELAPFAELIKKPGWNVLALAGDLAIEAEWYLFVVDVTTDGLVNWVSQAYQYAGCTSEAGGWAEGHSGDAIFLFGDDDLNCEWKTSQDVIAAGPTVVLPAGDVRCSATLSWGQFESLEPTKMMYPVFLIDGEPMRYKPKYGWNANTNTGTATSVAFKREGGQSGHIVRCKVFWEGGWPYMTSAMVQISTSPDLKSMLNPDP
jgi:hypothetical protein